jgi:hypothetical protein
MILLSGIDVVKSPPMPMLTEPEPVVVAALMFSLICRSPPIDSDTLLSL